MRLWRTLLLIAMLLALPGLAQAAAPRQLAPGEYERVLLQATAHLEAAQRAASAHNTEVGRARALLEPGFVVQTRAGAVTVDHRSTLALLDKAAPATDDGRRHLELALLHLREHLQAVKAFSQGEVRKVPGAREELELALKAAETRSRWTQRLVEWLIRLLGLGRSGDEAAETTVKANGWAVIIIALAAGSVGVFLLGRALLSLWGHGAGNEAHLRSGNGAHPDRPVTPDDLWQLAGRQAAAGDYKEALRVAHLALLKHYDRLGLLRYVPSQTNREHEWMLRRKHPELARTLHALNDLVEARLYAGYGASAEDYARGESLAAQLWREGDAVSRTAHATTGASSSASSS